MTTLSGSGWLLLQYAINFTFSIAQFRSTETVSDEFSLLHSAILPG